MEVFDRTKQQYLESELYMSLFRLPICVVSSRILVHVSKLALYTTQWRDGTQRVMFEH